jgi:haloacetate dehalogenase
VITRRRLLQQSTALAAAAAVGNLRETAAQGAAGSSSSLFQGFKTSKVATAGATIHVVSGGQGTPVLLLHGYPQTHVIWHKIAPLLAAEFSLVIPDLRGYGDSSKPPNGENHYNYSKRAMAQDQVDVMRHFGFEKFAVVGHDRGGRVGHRMALDHPDRVTKLAVLDIVPTYKLFHSVSKQFATAYYHWFFLIQPAPFPETLIGNNVEFFLRQAFQRLIPNAVTPEAFAEYLRCYSDPATIHASCEDYRAAASIDLEHDESDLGRKVACPLLALWAERGAMHPLFDVAAAWRERAANVTGKVLLGGHFLPRRLLTRRLPSSLHSSALSPCETVAGASSPSRNQKARRPESPGQTSQHCPIALTSPSAQSWQA